MSELFASVNPEEKQITLGPEPFDQVVKCEPCKARFTFKGRREIKNCPYCGSVAKKE